MQETPKQILYGVLSRGTFDDGQAQLRVAPFSLSTEGGGRPVWSLVFAEPHFDFEALRAHLGNEVEVEIFSQNAVLYDVWSGEQQKLGGTLLTVDQVSYDVVDYQEYVARLAGEVDDLGNRYSAANEKNNRGRALVEELLRRAEIKAAASERQCALQAPAIEVLKRIRRHFEE